MAQKLISIQEASDLSHKSIQTIRRSIKAKKIKFKKLKTPQGFNYLVDHASLCALFSIPAQKETAVKAQKKAKKENFAEKIPGKKIPLEKGDFASLAKTLERMVAQHADERQNFLRLMNSLQEKIFVLENQLNLLKEPKRHWYQLWK